LQTGHLQIADDHVGMEVERQGQRRHPVADAAHAVAGRDQDSLFEELTDVAVVVGNEDQR
jgi:hypothetical protein